MADDPGKQQAIAKNRRARFEYEIFDTFEAGISLLGPEVKSLRAGRANLSDSYAAIRRGEVYLRNAHISPYKEAGRDNPDPRRERKLLLHRREIRRLESKVTEKGLTLVPLCVYFNEKGLAKVEIALARGKAVHDKRQDLKRQDAKRDIDRQMRGR